LLSLGVPLSANAQCGVIEHKMKEWQIEGKLPPQFEVDGHSLGGYLAAVLRKNYPEVINHAYNYQEI
jgi:hypothetical protein